MAESFIDVGVTTSEQTLADDAIDRLRALWPGWEPNDGDLEVVQIETLAPMAQNAAETAARVPAAIFRAYGTKLAGLPYRDGTPAVAAILITLLDADPIADRTVPARSFFDIDGYAFATDHATTFEAGNNGPLSLPVTATANGTAQNGLTGDSISQISALSFIDTITLDPVPGVTAGGGDPEDNLAYQDRLSRDLELQAKTLVTERDFELMGLSVPGVGRLVAINDGERNVRVVGTDLVGEPLTTGIKTALVDLYALYRQVNTVVTVDDAAYTTANVTYTVHPDPGVEPADLTARIDEMLETALLPVNFARPQNPWQSAWQNDPVVRKNRVIRMIGAIYGVDYVTTVTLAGTGATVETNGDLTLPGDIALTRPGTMTGTVA